MEDIFLPHLINNESFSVNYISTGISTNFNTDIQNRIQEGLQVGFEQL